MARFGPKLERRQLLLGRFVDIGTELFAIVASCARAQSLRERANEASAEETLLLADFFCQSARLRIEQNFKRLHQNVDRQGHDLAQRVLNGKCIWLEKGIVDGEVG
jgi:hypothetical protein